MPISHLFIKKTGGWVSAAWRLQKSSPAPCYSSFQIADKREPFIPYQMRCAVFLIERELKTKRREGKKEESPCPHAISKCNLDISYFEVRDRVQRGSLMLSHSFMRARCLTLGTIVSSAGTESTFL